MARPFHMTPPVAQPQRVEYGTPGAVANWSGEGYDYYLVPDISEQQAEYDAWVEEASTDKQSGWERITNNNLDSLNYSQMLAKYTGMTPREYWEFSGGVVGSQNLNPYANDWATFKALAEKNGLMSNPEFANYYNSLIPQWQGGGDKWADTQFARQKGHATLQNILSGIGFVAGAMSGFGAIGGESFLGSVFGSGGETSTLSGLSSAANTASKFVIGEQGGNAPFGQGASTILGEEVPSYYNAPAAAAAIEPAPQTVSKVAGVPRKGNVPVPVVRRRGRGGRASTILGDYYGEDVLG